MFSYNNVKKMVKYRPSANQKYVNAAPLKWYFLKINKFWLKYIKKTALQRFNIFSHHHLMYISDGQLVHFLLQFWLGKVNKYKTRFLHGPFYGQRVITPTVYVEVVNQVETRLCNYCNYTYYELRCCLKIRKVSC